MATKPDDAPMLALIETPDNPAPTLAEQARIVLLDGQAFDQFYDRMKAETDRHTPDVSTDAGRRAIISLARRVTTTKTTITAAAKGLTEGWRDQTAKVNAARRPIEERLAALAEDVRRPVTEWEAAEAARRERNAATIQRIRDAATVGADETASSVERRGRELHDAVIDGDDWTAEQRDAWWAAKDASVKALVAARDRLRQEEADRAELSRLRAAEAERVERQRIADAEREAAAAAEREQAAVEQRARDAEAQRERDRQEAADRARREAEIAAAQEAACVQREADAALAAERAERERLEQVERDRQAAEALQVAEDAKRARNRAHVASVMGEAKLAIMSCGVGEDVSRAIVVAIKAGQVPHVGITL